MTALPPALAAALDSLLNGVSRRDLAARAARLSAVYRGGGGSAAIAGEGDALAYAVARMPATYAAVRTVFARLAEAMPGFAPGSVADIGVGPGTASWAARDAWPGLERIAMLERNAAFRDLAEVLAAQGLEGAQMVAGDLSGAVPKADLVVASYVLAELPDADAAARHLWGAAGRALVLVEPGTPQGFARIRAARDALIAAGGHMAAPCTHDAACPMPGNDWCHFSQRLPRSRDHKLAKDASVPFEDERYCYLAATRMPVAKGARIIKPPEETKPGIALALCDASGLRESFAPRRDREAFRGARRLGWGDLILG